MAHPLLDAAVSLHLVQGDGGLKPLWARHFKRAKGAFGRAGLGQLRKHLAARPPAENAPLAVIDPGPGRPVVRTGPCRWCVTVLQKGQGVLVGRGEAVQVEHRRKIRHVGRCEDHPSYEEYEHWQAEQRAAEEGQLATENVTEAKLARRRAAGAEKRRLVREVKAAKELAEATQARVESLTAVDEVGRTEHPGRAAPPPPCRWSFARPVLTGPGVWTAGAWPPCSAAPASGPAPLLCPSATGTPYSHQVVLSQAGCVPATPWRRPRRR